MPKHKGVDPRAKSHPTTAGTVRTMLTRRWVSIQRVLKKGGIWIVPLCGLWMSLLSLPAEQLKDENFESFEDELLVLSKLSENLTLDALSLKSFRCREKILLKEIGIGSQIARQLEWEHPYRILRLPRQRAVSEAAFTETREWRAADSTNAAELSEASPLFDTPFTGYVSQMFAFDNRLSNDFKKVREEKIRGRDCLVLAFDTVPEITRKKITILKSEVPLRQRGLLWVTKDDFRLVRLKSTQLKLPKGCRGYEYQLDYAAENLNGRLNYLPASLVLKISLNNKGYEIEQKYSEFKTLP